MKTRRLFTSSWLVISLPILAGCAAQPASAQGAQSEDGQHQGEAELAARVPSHKAQPPAANDANLSEEEREILERHNRYRSQHCAEPVAWSERLARTARAWAKKLQKSGCAFKHSADGKYGENLFFTAPSSGESGMGAVETWYEESRSYNFKTPGFSMNTGHFTQIVWRETRELGCGKAQCNGGDIWVCNYSPPGNVGSRYRENVRPRTCR